MEIKDLFQKDFVLFVELKKDNLSFVDLLEKIEVDGIIFPSKSDIRRIKRECLVGCYYEEGEDYSELDFCVIDLKKKLKSKEKIDFLGKIGQGYDLDSILNIDPEIFKGVLAEVTSYPKNKFLTVGDLQTYISMALSSPIPVLISTKKNIHPSEVKLLHDADVKGIVLTKNAYGDTENSFLKTVSSFKKEIDNLSEQ